MNVIPLKATGRAIRRMVHVDLHGRSEICHVLCCLNNAPAPFHSH